jgi:hypothetical protein
VPLAGICAGLAVQFKITFVAAAVAGTLWLLLRQQWKDSAKFATCAALAAAVPYLLYYFREPLMPSQMLALSPGIVNVTGNITLMELAVGELVVALALFGLVPVVRRFWPRWALLIMFATVSFAVAALTDFQAGGAVNYYFEALFAFVPLAVLGTMRIMARAPRYATLTFFVLALFGVQFVAPRVLFAYNQLIFARDDSVDTRNDTIRNVERVVRGHRLFSTVPRLALLDPAPPLVEPYLLFYMQSLGKLDPEPIFGGVRRGEYDLVITDQAPVGYRGLSIIGPELRDAIATTYQPECVLQSWLVHLPIERRATTGQLAKDLADIGCKPPSKAVSSGW